MYAIYFIAYFNPLLALPAVLAALQFAIHFKRQKKRSPTVFFVMLALFLVLTSAAWIFFRGDLHSQKWAKILVESFHLRLQH